LRAKEVEKDVFIGVKPGEMIGRGDRLTRSKLVPVGIPRNSVGNIEDFAIRWDKVETVEGEPVWRPLAGSSLLLSNDLRTPPQELKLAKDEQAMWVPVDNRRFVPSLVVPGDRVSFIVTRGSGPTPAVRRLPASAPEEDPDSTAETTSATPVGKTRIIGPFEVLSLGNRLGSVDVMQAARIRQSQENVMTIRVRIEGGQLEQKAQDLLDELHASRFGALDVLLHSRERGER
jgi:Flp pilus assembly protein CpaB